MSTKTMTLSQVMKHLEQQGDEKVRLRYLRDGAGDDVFGVLLGKIRGLAETLGTNHDLGLELWETGNHEARILACIVLDPEALTEKEARALLEPLSNPTLVDELVGRTLVHAPVAAALQTALDGRQGRAAPPRWMEDPRRAHRARVGEGPRRRRDARAHRARAAARSVPGQGGHQLLPLPDRRPPPGPPRRGHRRRRAARPMGSETGLEGLHAELRAGVDTGLARALQRREDGGPQGDGRGRKAEALERECRTDQEELQKKPSAGSDDAHNG